MQTRMLNAVTKAAAIAGILLVAGVASAQTDVHLQAERFIKSIPDGNGGATDVEMWGFASCDVLADLSWDCGPVTSPGPQITAAEGDTVTIHVRNALTNMPVSVVIPGQRGTGAPEYTASTVPGQPPRMTSMTTSTAPGADFSYSFTNVREGTYLYQTGTYPSLAVPMGLYGALVVSPAAGATCTDATQSSAYGDEPSCFDADRVLLFSEVDPIQNARVYDAEMVAVPGAACLAMADYAGSLATGYPCTVDYNPMYLLINGEPSADLIGDDAVATGDEVLLRMVNAGLRSRAPSIVGVEMELIAEDGFRYPGKTVSQSSVLVASGKTLDAKILAPSTDTNLSFFERMPSFNNETVPNGGSLGTVQVGNPTPPTPPGVDAVDDAFTFNEDNPLTGKNVLDNDIGLNGATVQQSAGSAPAGLVTVNADGTFTYDANGHSGIDTFSYDALLEGVIVDTAFVTINVSFTDEAPTARPDAYTNTFGPNIDVAAPGVLANDSDPDGDPLTATLVSGPSAGTLTLNPDGSFTFEPPASGDYSFTYTASDDGGVTETDPVTVSLHTDPVAGLTLNVTDGNGNVVTDYHWTVEEDATWQPDPGNQQVQTLGSNFHRSYMPVVGKGVGAASIAELALDPSKHYYVSVLPLNAWAPDGNNLGGARIMPGQTEVDVLANTLPTPYAQISIIVFNDNVPTNGAIDEGEVGLGGFQVTLEDAGGRYGASAGVMWKDANDDPLVNSLDCFGGDDPPTGIIVSCPNTPANQANGLVGHVLIKNLWPGKYGVIVNEPLEQVGQWAQTSTIEGTKVIDAWVKAAEPPYFQEFGPPGPHVFVGFVNPDAINAANEGGPNTLTGKVTNIHMSRPPVQTLWDSDSYAALSHTRAWVGVNSVGGEGPLIAAVQANEDGTFSIPNLPDGVHQIVVWDKYLDQVIGYRTVSLPTDNNAGNVPVFNWFARLENHVFFDEDGDGFRDPGENGMLEQNTMLRWRDGSVYQAFPTDTEGFAPYDQMFPFFHWLVAEVDYARYEATGVTVTVDNGGDAASAADPFTGVLVPQDQGGGATSYTLDEPVLTLGVQGFLGQTSVIEWGKRPWQPGQNGGISGVVYYATTRAENDPRFGVAEPWEVGVPRVTVRLYREVARPDGSTKLVLLDETQTDSWDDDLPTGCPATPDNLADVAFTGGPVDKCYDGIRNFNQVRPAVFDGGYAFDGIDPGKYVVEIVPPPGYEIVKEEDVNVGFGETFGDAAPAAALLPGGALLAETLPDPATIQAAQAAEPGLTMPPCVGDLHTVPDYLSIFPGAMEPAPFKGTDRPLCDRKEVILPDQGQAAADFFLFTQGPIAAHATGMILDDNAQEFNPLSPNFGEKWAPPFVPVSVRDYTGKEISRLYADQWGRFNMLVPSTYSANEPSPSGMSPNMLLTCKNDPGPIPDPDNPGELMVDPNYNPAYGTHCFTFQYMAGTTTYLDTPVMPNSAFASGYNPVDCEPATETPRIRQVDGDSFGPFVTQGGTLTIYSQGATDVSNPAYEGPVATGLAGEPTIERDFGFGLTAGTVLLDGVAIDPAAVTWGDGSITWTVSDDPDAPDYVAAGEYQLVVTHANGNSTTEGVTVTVGDATTPVPTRVGELGSIQAAIDAADPGDLIIVGPYSYEEIVIMWKPVRLQGSGPGATFISGLKRPTEKLANWRTKMDCLFGIGAGCTKVVDALPGQVAAATGFDTEEGATITVLGPSAKKAKNTFTKGDRARIDGMSISGGDTGGGVFVNGYAHRLRISNNRVFGNSGSYHGGIRIGRVFLQLDGNGPFEFNDNVDIRYNAVFQNAAFDGAGAGISLATGSDRYSVTNNFVCGNFTQGDGAGIGHLGISDRGKIEDNTVVFNQSFFQGAPRHGGGIFIGGEPIALAEADGPLTRGAGTVNVQRNLIKGNHAAAGQGGGIRAQFVNGQDVIDTIKKNKAQPSDWFAIKVLDNTIVNNVSGGAGGGISLQDVAQSTITGNTVAHNDSTSTIADTFLDGPDQPSVAQTAGIVSAPHSAELTASILSQNNTDDLRFFSNPAMGDNVIWQNRSFYYDASSGTALLEPQLAQGSVGACDTSAVYDDLGVLGDNAFTLDPGTSILTGDPLFTGFAAPYCNGGRTLIGAPGPIVPFPALDEGGATWIDVRFGPITPIGDYTILP